MKDFRARTLVVVVSFIQNIGMQHYKVRQGNWPGNIWLILAFVIGFELVSYFLFAPLLRMLHLL